MRRRTVKYEEGKRRGDGEEIEEWKKGKKRWNEKRREKEKCD
jgi:hypothetical protein